MQFVHKTDGQQASSHRAAVAHQPWPASPELCASPLLSLCSADPPGVCLSPLGPQGAQGHCHPEARCGAGWLAGASSGQLRARHCHPVWLPEALAKAKQPEGPQDRSTLGGAPETPSTGMENKIVQLQRKIDPTRSVSPLPPGVGVSCDSMGTFERDPQLPQGSSQLIPTQLHEAILWVMFLTVDLEHQILGQGHRIRKC